MWHRHKEGPNVTRRIKPEIKSDSNDISVKPEEAKKYDRAFRRRYLLRYGDFDNRSINEYEEIYFTDSRELEELKKEELRLIYEYRLNMLTDDERKYFEKLIPFLLPAKRQKFEETKTMSRDELEMELDELNKTK